MIDNRPLSPHLSIHKKVLTAVFSIFHRITGIGLSIGAILISVWFILISLGPEYFYYFKIISQNILFKFVLLIWSVGIFYHLFNGVRKLYWSFGIGMDLISVYRSGYIVIFLTILSTIVVWVIV
ncbi:succinate dehydrogenase, cytochrome b556 subunit [Pelagibacteraceae bacterium]|mgnify:FL=1|nr:succinate dehydrogenase, cytochrome b556 subunit [Pelagibacteraceae bacterium]|tara:strand:+ start:7381 stop:7752 length:372 start_codon:yes stop_codon:yes gene_type:complete